MCLYRSFWFQMKTLLNGDEDIKGVVPDDIDLFHCSTA